MNLTTSPLSTDSLEDTSFEAQLEQSLTKKLEYDEWMKSYAADCMAKGIAIGNSYARQRAWNEHQKQLSQQRREQKRAEAKSKQLAERIRRAQAELTRLREAGITDSQAGHWNTATPAAQLHNKVNTEQEDPGDEFFARIDAEVAAIQAGDTGGCPHTPQMTPERAAQILQDEEAALRKNNLGEL